VVFPRLVAAEHRQPALYEPVSSGVDALDALLGGGPRRGTSLLLMGPSGSGKSSVATRYALAAAERGERAFIFAFDESAAMLRSRSAALGMDLARHVENGTLVIQQIDPAELSPGEFNQVVRRAVESEGARVVVLDSLNGYISAMPEERFVLLQLHELLSFLGQQGLLTILTVAQHGLVASESTAPIDVSYLADGVLLFRYFEAAGKVRKALSAVKNRPGPHETTIREVALGPEGVRVGPVLAEFRGVMTGVPEWVGGSAPRAPGGA
jgi:circadian clock protein KaiC